MPAKDYLERMRRKQGLATPAPQPQQPPPRVQKPIARLPEALGQPAGLPESVEATNRLNQARQMLRKAGLTPEQRKILGEELKNPKFGFKAPPPPFVGSETIRAACGHEVPFGFWAKDPFKERRKQKALESPCKECRLKRAAELEAQQREDRKRRKEERRRKGRQRGWKLAAHGHLARLPHGSRFEGLVYDGDIQTWAGRLVVPEPVFSAPEGSERSPENVLVFSGTASAVFELLAVLDGQWRDWLDQHRPQEEGTGEGGHAGHDPGVDQTGPAVEGG
jgi:hypothetical protein